MFIILGVIFVFEVRSILLRQVSFSEDLDAVLPEEFESDVELAEAVDDLDDDLTLYIDGDDYDVDYFDVAIEDVNNILRELDGEEYVILNDIEMDDKELLEYKNYAIEGNDAKYGLVGDTLKVEEYLIDELEAALEQDLGGIIEELTNELDIWEDLLEIMEEDDFIVVFEEKYSYEDVQEEIAKLEQEIEELEATE